MPHKLSQQLRGELDWIVMKALEKDRTRRYESSSGLAKDIERYLGDEAVEACPPSTAYRLRKFARRNRALLITTAAFVLTLTAATATSFWQAHRANVARELADGRLVLANESRRATAIALSDRSVALGESERRREQAEANLQMAVEAVDRLLRRVGADQMAHGKVEHAGQFLGEALDFYERILRQSDDPAIRLQAGLAYRQSALGYLFAGNYEQSEIAVRRALKLFSDLVREQPGNPEFQDCLAHCHNELGNALYSWNRITDAEVAYRQALKLREGLCAEFPGEPKYQLSLSDPLGNLATISWEQGQLEDAEKSFRRVLSLEEAAPQAMRENVDHLMEHAGTSMNFAMLLRDRQKFAESQRLLEDAVRLQQKVLASQPDHPKVRNGLYDALWNLSETLVVQGEHAAGAEAAERLVAEYSSRLQAYHEAAEMLLRCASLARQSADGEVLAQSYEQRGRQLLEQASSACRGDSRYRESAGVVSRHLRKRRFPRSAAGHATCPTVGPTDAATPQGQRRTLRASGKIGNCALASNALYRHRCISHRKVRGRRNDGGAVAIGYRGGRAAFRGTGGSALGGESTPSAE